MNAERIIASVHQRRVLDFNARAAIAAAYAAAHQPVQQPVAPAQQQRRAA